MDELIAFLRARYDEREDVALDTARGYPSPWSVENNSVHDADGYAVLIDEPHDHGALRYIALNDPGHVLADIAGKRKIVDMAEHQDGYHLPEGVNDGRDYDERIRDEGVQVMLAEVLHCLAEEFAAHPDYNAKDWGEFVQPQGGDRR